MAITFKKLSGDTEVIANPTLDGSETALSGLQIDGVKYAMGGGASGGTLKTVLKEYVDVSANKTETAVGNYKDKVLLINVETTIWVLPMNKESAKKTLVIGWHGASSYAKVAFVKPDVNYETLTIQNIDTTNRRFYIYELGVA